MLLMLESEETGLSDLNQCNSQFLIKAPSKRIRAFFESATFSFRSQKFPRPHVSDSYPDLL